MLIKLIAWIATTQTGKVTAVTTGVGLTSSGLLGLIFALHSSAMAEIKNQKIDTRQYVVEKIDSREEIFQLHIKNFSDKQDDTNERLDTVIEHIMNNK